jgi:hypothetical protein
MFYQKLFQKCCMEIHVKIDIYVHFICTKYTWDLIKNMYIGGIIFKRELIWNEWFEMGLNLKQKDEQKSHRKLTRTKYIDFRFYK